MVRTVLKQSDVNMEALHMTDSIAAHDVSPTVAVTSRNGSHVTERDEELARVEVAVLAIIFCLALFGNSCVLFALRYRRKKTSRMHLFIMHLSIADLLVAFCNILPQLAWDITYRFQGPDVLCRVVKYLQILVMYLSTYILVATAVDRYRAICHPLSNYSWSPRKVNLMIASAWITSLLLSIPQMVIFRIQEVKPGEFDCWDHFSPQWTVKLYITFFALSVYIIPFIVLALLYGRICYVVWENVRRKGSSGVVTNYGDGKVVYKFNGTGTISIIAPNGKLQEVTSERRHVVRHPRTHSGRGFSRSKMKTIKLTFVVIIAYLICWSPFFIAQMWWAYDSKAPIGNSTFVICLLLASLNSCCNPWIYMAFSGSLIQQLLPCCRKPIHRPPRLREHVLDLPEIESKSSSCSSDAHDMHGEKIPMDAHFKYHHHHYHHHHHNRCLENNISLTSSTKVTGGTMSPRNSLKSRVDSLPACSCRACVVSSNPTITNVTSSHKKPKSMREELQTRALLRRECACTCSGLHEIQEDRFGEKRENVFYDLSLARKMRKTSSHPTLFSKGTSYERVDTRCTTSV